MVQKYSILNYNELQYLCQEINFEPYFMPKNIQNLVILMEPSEHAHEVSLNSGNMYLNRFCIDEDAAFEISGVHYLKTPSDGITYDDQFDDQAIDFAFQEIVKSKTENMETHFVYTGKYYWIHKARLRSSILKKMKKYKIKKVITTIINMSRKNLITQEKMRSFCNGKEFEKESVNDDLDSFYEDHRLGKKPDEFVRTYFLPRLATEELELIEAKDSDFMQTFDLKMKADVDKSEMKLSKSDSKFVYCYGWRQSFTIENSLKRYFAPKLRDVIRTEMKASESDSKFVYGMDLRRSIHISIEDIKCDETCAVDCPSKFQKFQFKNGEFVKTTDDNRIGQGGFGSVFKGLFHGKEKAMKYVFIGQMGFREFTEHSAADFEKNISEMRNKIACAGAGILAPEALVRQQNQEQDQNGKWIAKNYNVYIYPLYDCNLYELHDKYFDNFTETILSEIIHQCFIRNDFEGILS